MLDSPSKKNDKKFLADLDRKYRGRAKVCLDQLVCFGPYVRDPDRKSIESLKLAFGRGEKRHLRETHVPVKLSQRSFEAALGLSHLQSHELLEHSPEPPFLELPKDSLVCLHGRQRIEAAQSYFVGRDRWWPVKLYIEDDDKEWQRRLAEGDTKSHAYSDGEIFWNIRECAKLASKQGEDEMNAYLAERRWWDQLSKRKQDFLKYLLKHPLLRSFDRLLFLPGIWRGFNIGVLDKLIALRCDEEVSNYIEHIRKTWKTILKRNKTVARLIDPESVRLVQSRAPAASENDQRQIQFLMLKGILWPNIQDRSTRRKIKNQMEKIYWLIPTMHTLFEDIKYLKACQQAVKRLLPPLEGRTIYETARRAYENPHRGTFWVSYVRLWLFAMRNFATLTGATPRKERYGDDVSTDVSPFSWFQFAKEARTCGFATQSINEHLQQDPHMQTAEAILLKAKPSIAKDGTAEFKKYVERIADIVKASNTPPERTEPPTMFSTNSGEPIRRRCGRVYHKTYIKLQEHIDLAAIEEFQKANREQTQGYDITSLFVRQCVFNAFFGRLDLPISTPPTNSNGSPVPSPIETDTHENQLDEDHPMASPVERLQPTVSDADPSDRTEPRSATMLNHNCMLIDALPTMDTQEQLSTIDRQEHPSKIYTQEYPPTMDWQNQGSVIGNRDHPLAIATQEQLTSGNTQETTVVSQENLSTSLIRSHHYVGTADSGPEPAVSDQISMDNHDNITTNPIVDETTDHANTGATTHLYRRSHGRQRRDTLHRRREARSRTWGRRDEREAGSSRPRSPSRYRRHRSHYRDRRDESLRDVPRGGYSQPTQGAGSDATAVTNLQVVQFDPTHATQHDPGESNMVFHEEQISNAQNVTGAFAGLGSSFTFTGPFVTTHRSLDTETGIFGLTRTELAVPPASGYFQESSDAAAENPPWPISEVPQPISPLQRSSETFEYATNVTSTNHNVAGESSGRSAAIDPNIGTSRSQTFCTEREDGHQTPEHLDSHHADGSYREEAFLFENPEDDICEDAGSGQPEPDQERRQALAQDAQDAQDAPFITLQGVPATPGESSVQLNSPQNVDMAGALRRRRSSEGIRLEQSEEMDAAKRRKLEDKALVALRTEYEPRPGRVPMIWIRNLEGHRRQYDQVEAKKVATDALAHGQSLMGERNRYLNINNFFEATYRTEEQLVQIVRPTPTSYYTSQEYSHAAVGSNAPVLGVIYDDEYDPDLSLPVSP